MSVQLTVFDGTNCIGGNKIHLAADGTNVFFDFGLNYSIKSQFFDEFLRPRSSLGLVDYLSTGLLPPIPGIYRDDLVPPGVNLWHRYNGTDFGDIEPQAILLSHAHNDHLQLVSFLKPHIPIYSVSYQQSSQDPTGHWTRRSRFRDHLHSPQRRMGGTFTFQTLSHLSRPRATIPYCRS